MEFNEKLQNLRKKNNISQQELAQKLYVSRAAISKWESGRGTPNIESLKNISKIFSVSVDELLSTDELITFAMEESKKREGNFKDLIFGLLDICALLLFFLPLFAQRIGTIVNEVSLLKLTYFSPYIRISFILLTVFTAIFGVLLLALQNYDKKFWLNYKYKISFFLSILEIIMFIASLQPYAAIFLFSLLIIKVLILIKKQCY